MSIPKCLDFNDYNKYPNDANPTTNADMQEYLLNQNRMTQAFSSCFWQPNTQYEAKQIIRSNSLPAGIYAVVSRAGRSGTNEPTWKSSGTVTDGTVTWTMRDIFAEIESKYAKVGTVSIGNSNVTVSDGTNTTALTPNVLNFGSTILVNATPSNNGGHIRIQAGTNCYIMIGSGIGSESGEPYKTFQLSHNPSVYSNSNEIATTKFVKDQKYLVASDITGKLDISSVADYVIQTGKSTSGNIWFRKWSSGWLEVGGYVTFASAGYNQVEFPASFADDNYTVVLQMVTTGDAYTGTTAPSYYTVSGKTATGFKVYGHPTAVGLQTKNFYACGMGA